MFAKLTLACAVAAAIAAPAAAAGGPMFVVQGGTGIVSGVTRYIPIPDYQANDTQLISVSTKDGSQLRQLSLAGAWGIPSTGAGSTGISLDGKRLVLADVNAGLNSPSRFMVVDPRTMRVVRPISLDGYFSFDAMSPDGSKLYFVQYTTDAGVADLSHYIVRGYDAKTNRLLPGRIADRTQKSWVMQGYPVTRTTSVDGRWVYTLYQNPGGYPFVHALDTVRGVAHCVGIPLRNQNGIYNLVLGLHGRTLSVHWRSGRPFVDVNTSTWAVTPGHRGGFPWWTLSFAALLPLGGAALLLLRRRRRPDMSGMDDELAEILRQPELVA